MTENPETEDELEALLWKRLEGELSSHEARTLEERLNEDAEARELARQVEEVGALLAGAEDLEVPGELAGRVEWLVRRKPTPSQEIEIRSAPRVESNGQGRWFVPLAAAALIGAIGLVLTVGRSPSGPGGDELVAGSAIMDPDRGSEATEGSSEVVPGTFRVGADGRLEVSRVDTTLTVVWEAGEQPRAVTIEALGSTIEPAEEASFETEAIDGGVRMSVPAGQGARLRLALPGLSGEITLRVVRSGSVLLEEVLDPGRLPEGGVGSGNGEDPAPVVD